MPLITTLNNQLIHRLTHVISSHDLYLVIVVLKLASGISFTRSGTRIELLTTPSERKDYLNLTRCFCVVLMCVIKMCSVTRSCTYACEFESGTASSYQDRAYPCSNSPLWWRIKISYAGSRTRVQLFETLYVTKDTKTRLLKHVWGANMNGKWDIFVFSLFLTWSLRANNFLVWKKL